jgi:4-amino-4-deoxy-L-arabinose transferase-like glycosyltransferase
MKPSSTRSLLIIVGLLLLAFVLRLSAAGWWQSRLGDPQAFGFPDSHSYWFLAEQLATGQPYEYGGPEFQVFRTPAYPLALAGLFRLVGEDASVMWARGLGAFLGTLAVGAIAWLTYILFDERAAWIAACLAAVYPGAIAMSVFVLSEALFCPLMVAHLACWVYATRAESTRRTIAWGALSGALAGLATLTRPSWLLFVPFAGTLAVLAFRPRRRQVLVVVWLLVGMATAMTPWWVRNYRVTGAFVPTTLQVGASLYDGLHPNATGASNMDFVPRFYAEQKAADARDPNLSGVFETRLSQRMRDAAVQWATTHPARVFALMRAKFVRMWNLWPNAAEFRSWKLRLIIVVGYVPLLVLALWGTWKYASRGWGYVLCVMPAVYFTCLHVVFVSSLRYRQPAMLIWIVLAAGVLEQATRSKGEDVPRR